jgi:predicted nucleic acid-binding protein
MILEAHTAARRKLFVTGDAKAFILNGRREQLQGLLSTRIVTAAEFEAELNEKASGV